MDVRLTDQYREAEHFAAAASDAMAAREVIVLFLDSTF